MAAGVLLLCLGGCAPPVSSMDGEKWSREGITTIHHILVATDSFDAVAVADADPWDEIAAVLWSDAEQTSWARHEPTDSDIGAQEAALGAAAPVLEVLGEYAPEGSRVTSVKEVARFQRIVGVPAAANAASYATPTARTVHVLRVSLWQPLLALGTATTAAAVGVLAAIFPRSLGADDWCAEPSRGSCPWMFPDDAAIGFEAIDHGPGVSPGFYAALAASLTADASVNGLASAIIDQQPYDLAIGLGTHGVEWVEPAGIRLSLPTARPGYNLERFIRLEDGRIVGLYVQPDGQAVVVESTDELDGPLSANPSNGRRYAIPPPAAVDDPDHARIRKILREGQVVDAGPYSHSDNKHTLYWARLRDPSSGEELEALFKPRLWGDEDGYAVIPYEQEAYELNLALLMDYVPVAAYRYDIDLAFEHFSEGVMLYRAAGVQDLVDTARDEWPFSPVLFESDTRILDILLQNADRHWRQVLMGEHWKDGVQSPILIDHAASHRAGNQVSLDHDWFAGDPSFNAGEVRVIRRRTFEALKLLTAENLMAILSHQQSRDRIGEILDKRDEIVRFFEEYAPQQEPGTVIIDYDG